MIETLTSILIYVLVFAIGVAYGTYHSSKEFIKRNEKLLQLLDSAQKVIESQMLVIEGMKKVRPVFKTITKEGPNADA